MKLELELDIDMNQINYDEINEQIKEKISNVSAEDVFNRYYFTDESIREYINKRINEKSNDWMVSQGWYSSNNEAKSNISNLARDVMKEKLDSMMNNWLDKITQDDINKIMQEIFPAIVSSVISQQVMSGFSNYFDSQDSTNMLKTRSIVESVLNGKCY